MLEFRTCLWRFFYSMELFVYLLPSFYWFVHPISAACYIYLPPVHLRSFNSIANTSCFVLNTQLRAKLQEVHAEISKAELLSDGTLAEEHTTEAITTTSSSSLSSSSSSSSSASSSSPSSYEEEKYQQVEKEPCSTELRVPKTSKRSSEIERRLKDTNNYSSKVAGKVLFLNTGYFFFFFFILFQNVLIHNNTTISYCGAYKLQF